MIFEKITLWVTERYHISSVTCELLRSYTNDVYLIRSAQGEFVLKVYGLRWRSDEEVRYEIELIRHVLNNNVPVAVPMIGINEDYVQDMSTVAGKRAAVLFEYVPGNKPTPPFSTVLYEKFGRAIARFHHAADRFLTSKPRQALNTTTLIDEPVLLAASLLSDINERTWLHRYARHIKDHIVAYGVGELDWGPIHGDATLDNLHLTGQGTIVLFDFDSGGPGWRSADLQGWASINSDYKSYWNAFQRGYNQVRPLSDANRMAAPYLTAAWDIWGMKVDLERRIIQQGPARVQEYLANQLIVLRSMCVQLNSGKNR